MSDKIRGMEATRVIFDNVLARVPHEPKPTPLLMRDLAKLAIRIHGPLISEDALTDLLSEVYTVAHIRGAAQRQRELFDNQPKRKKRK